MLLKSDHAERSPCSNRITPQQPRMCMDYELVARYVVLLFSDKIGAFPQTLDNQLFLLSSLVNVPNIIYVGVSAGSLRTDRFTHLS